MLTRSEFARELATMKLSHVERAVALLWYYRTTQEYEERSAAELAADLHDEGFPKPKVSRLGDDLRGSRDTARGTRPGTYQIDVRRVAGLDKKYLDLIGAKKIKVVGAILPPDMVKGTRRYLEQIVHQINAAYEYGLYDASAVLMRRLMESLLIEVYLSRGRQIEIQRNGNFLMLDPMITHIKGDTTITLSRAAPKTMDEIKQLGDTAAHDRTYVTQQVDIDDVKARYRKLATELLALANIS